MNNPTSSSSITQLAEQAVLQQAAAQETALEQAVDQYEALLHDPQAVATLRAQRLEQLRTAAQDQARYRAAGHGVYSELLFCGSGGSQQDTRTVATAFFDATKQSQRLVVHFYRPTSPFCDIFHEHLTRLAKQHLETRFCRINVQDCDSTTASGGSNNQAASFLVERLGIRVMPTLVLIHQRQAVHQVRGFDELGNTPAFTTAALERLLKKYGVLVLGNNNNNNNNDENESDDESDEERRGVNAIRLHRRQPRRRRGRIGSDGDDDEEEEEY